MAKTRPPVKPGDVPTTTTRETVRAAAEAQQPTGEIVQATRRGFYRGVIVNPGTTFGLLRPEDFSPQWMTHVDSGAPDQLSALLDRGRPPATPAPAPAAPPDLKTGDVI